MNEFDILNECQCVFWQITTVTDRLEANRGMAITFFIAILYRDLSVFNNNGQLEHSYIVMEMCWTKDKEILCLTVYFF